MLFDDADASVRRKSATCFWHLWRKPEIPLAEHHSLIARFLKSAAFAEAPSFLLHALEDSRHKLPEVVLNVCEHFVERCAAQARDIRTHHAGDEHAVGPLVFRAYQQLASEPAQLRALGLIDRMCEEGLQSAAKSLVLAYEKSSRESDGPMLITAPANETFWPGQSQELCDLLTCPKRLVWSKLS